MAVAMEVAWRGAELGGGGSATATVLDLDPKRAWGADTEKLMQLMMGQFGVSSSASGAVKSLEVTLDLLGASSAGGASPGSCRGAELDPKVSSQPEFLELDPDQPLPSGWEKCLDLKTGELYFVNKSTGVRTSEDPRKQFGKQQQLAAEVPKPSYEFLGSKRSETLREESLRASTSSGSSAGGDSNPKPARAQQQQQRLSFSTGKQLWDLQLVDERSTVGARILPSDEEESNVELELNLNLSPSHPNPQHAQSQSVCTMEMVEQALKRTEKAMGKREMLLGGPKLSVSSSFSSLTSTRSEPSWSHNSSPSTSSSSSTSSRSAARATPSDSQGAPRVCEAESRKADATIGGDALVMGACTRCLTYVMLHKSDPKCPRCESEAPLDFISPPSSKRPRLVDTAT